MGRFVNHHVNQTEPDLHGEIRKSPCKPDDGEIYMVICESPHLNLNVSLWFTWGDSQSPHVNERRWCVYMGRFVISPCKSRKMDIYVYIYKCIQWFLDRCLICFWRGFGKVLDCCFNDFPIYIFREIMRTPCKSNEIHSNH